MNKRETPQGQALSQTMDQQMSHVVRARAQLNHWNAFRQRVKGHPQPEDLRSAAQSRVDLIQLHMRNLELAEGALVQDLRMRPSPQEPARDGRMPQPKDAFGRRPIQPF